MRMRYRLGGKHVSTTCRYLRENWMGTSSSSWQQVVISINFQLSLAENFTRFCGLMSQCTMSVHRAPPIITTQLRHVSQTRDPDQMLMTMLLQTPPNIHAWTKTANHYPTHLSRYARKTLLAGSGGRCKLFESGEDGGCSSRSRPRSTHPSQKQHTSSVGWMSPLHEHQRRSCPTTAVTTSRHPTDHTVPKMRTVICYNYIDNS